MMLMMTMAMRTTTNNNNNDNGDDDVNNDKNIDGKLRRMVFKIFCRHDCNCVYYDLIVSSFR